MPGAIGRTAQVLSPRGGIKLGQIQTPGFYWAGFLSMILAVLKLTIEGALVVVACPFTRMGSLGP